MPSLCRIRWIPILMVAVSPVALTSCGVESEPASEISGPSPSPAPVNQSRVLPLNQRLLAIARRNSIARREVAPRESVRRVYDELGNVVEELVMTREGTYKRASSLPVALASRALSDFLPATLVAREGQSFSMTLPVISTRQSSVTLNGATVTFADTVETTAASMEDFLIQSASDPNWSSLGNVWYPDSTVIDSITASIGGAYYRMEGGYLVGYEIVGQDWQDALAEISTTFTGAVRLPQSTRSREQSALQQPLLSPGDCEVSGISLAKVPQQGPCDGERRYFWITSGATVAASVATTKVCLNPILRWRYCDDGIEITKGLITALGVAHAAYIACLAENDLLAARLGRREW